MAFTVSTGVPEHLLLGPHPWPLLLVLGFPDTYFRVPISGLHYSYWGSRTLTSGSPPVAFTVSTGVPAHLLQGPHQWPSLLVLGFPNTYFWVPTSGLYCEYWGSRTLTSGSPSVAFTVSTGVPEHLLLGPHQWPSLLVLGFPNTYFWVPTSGLYC